jgi:hypothetical protein
LYFKKIEIQCLFAYLKWRPNSGINISASILKHFYKTSGIHNIQDRKIEV